MATDTNVNDAADTPEDDPEYRKPNPQDNPRNIALAEIAASAAKKHGVHRPQTVFNIMTGKTWAKLTGIGRTRSIPLNRRGKVELRAVA